MLYYVQISGQRVDHAQFGHFLELVMCQSETCCHSASRLRCCYLPWQMLYLIHPKLCTAPSTFHKACKPRVKPQRFSDRFPRCHLAGRRTNDLPIFENLPASIGPPARIQGHNLFGTLADEGVKRGNINGAVLVWEPR